MPVLSRACKIPTEQYTNKLVEKTGEKKINSLATTRKRKIIGEKKLSNYEISFLRESLVMDEEEY